MALGEGAPENRKILAEHVNQTTIDRARTSDDAIARYHLLLHAEIDAIMLDIHVQLLERSCVQEHIQALTLIQLTLGVLSNDAFLTADQARGVTLAFKTSAHSLHRRPRFTSDISGGPFSDLT